VYHEQRVGSVRHNHQLVMEEPEHIAKHYKAHYTCSLFHKSRAFVRGLMGPVGGGKTVANIMELYVRACEQEPDAGGVRRTRWALIRNTYPELLSTTLKTFEEWIPPSVCPVTRGALIGGTLKVDLPDGTKVDAEFLFLALDKDDDAKKLKSLELTGAFINEASEIRETVLKLLTTRVGRYPKTVLDPVDDETVIFGPTWRGITMDTNPPDDTHWWYRLAEVEQPRGYEFFQQPPALIRVKSKDKDAPPEYVPNDGTQGPLAAENVKYLPGGFDYYLNQIGGKDLEWIKVFVMGEYGALVTGKPVYPEYSDQTHLAKVELEPYRGIPVLLAYDFGLTPACILLQQSPRGQLKVLDELISEDMGIERFARDVIKPFLLQEKYRGCTFYGVGDPAGVARAQGDETTCYQILEMQGLPADPAPSNAFSIRREAVAWFMTKMTDGEPGFLLSPTCKVLRKGFISGYHYRKMRLSGSDRFAETPDKNEYSHPHDALQYGCSFMRSASLDKSTDSFGNHGVRRKVKAAPARGWA